MSKNSFKNISMDYETYEKELSVQYSAGYRASLNLAIRIVEMAKKGMGEDDILHEIFNGVATQHEKDVVKGIVKLGRLYHAKEN